MIAHLQEQTRQNTVKILQSTTIYFKIQKQVNFGQALYLVGDKQILGNWDVAKGFRLNYGQNGFWRGVINLEILDSLEYKYVIADFNNPSSSEAIWENGKNRVINNTEMVNQQLFINEKWDSQKIIFNIISKKYEPEGQLFVIGNCLQLGLWVSPIHLHKIPSKENTQLQIWKAQINVQKFRTCMSYCFIYRSLTKLMKSKLFYKTFALQKENIQFNDVYYQPGFIQIKQNVVFNFNYQKTLKLNRRQTLPAYAQKNKFQRKLQKTNSNVVPQICD